MSDKKVLLFTDWYEPGYKAGGPIRSCKNIVTTLNDDVQFFIVTSDRDLNEDRPYENVTSNQWVRDANGTNVYYASPGRLGTGRIAEMVKKIAPDVIYLNSMFSLGYALKPLLTLRKIGFAGRIVLAPRGMLQASHLRYKPLKKQLFLRLASSIGVGKKLVFHATDEQERIDIRKWFGSGSKVIVASNITVLPDKPVARIKMPGSLKIVFVSRIHPLKNLDYAIELLINTPGLKNAEFDIYGATHDQQYYHRCFELARKLEGRVNVQFMGEVDHREVTGVLQQYHLFLFPTPGENFGHVIFEALAAGVPILTGDRTPWKNVNETGAGWAFPINEPAKFTDVIRRLYDMEQQEFDSYSVAAYKHAEQFVAGTNSRSIYKDLLLGRDQ